jgi:uncharacterized protein YjbI with pentapeptide repeats
MILLLAAMVAAPTCTDSRTADRTPAPTRSPIVADDECLEESKLRPNFGEKEVSDREFDDKDFGCGRFKEADLEGVRFADTRLSAADFRGANLRQVVFSNANLAFSDFEGASLKNVRFENSNLRAANFLNAQVEGLEVIDSFCPDGTHSDSANNSCRGHGLPDTKTSE